MLLHGRFFNSFDSRSGDLDPSVVAYMCEKLYCTPQKLIELLNGASGFQGIAGVSDSRDVEELYLKQKDEKAILAVDMYCYRVAKYISSYVVALGEKSLADLSEVFSATLDNEDDNFSTTLDGVSQISPPE